MTPGGECSYNAVMRSFLCLAALLVAWGPPAALAAPTLGPATRPAAPEARRVGIYPLERQGAPDPAYDRVQAYLKKNLATFPHVEAFDIATPQRCKADDLGCLVSVGRMAAADLVVHGSVERFNNGYAVRLQLIDVGRTTRREVKRFIPGGSADLVAAMELASCELVTTERCQGTLKIGGVAGAQVLVEARDVGTTPYEAPLAIGRHAVRVARDGLSTEDRFVNVSFNQETALAVQQQNGRLSFVDDFDAVPLPPDLLAEEGLEPEKPPAARPEARPAAAAAAKPAPALVPAPAPTETLVARADRPAPAASSFVAVAPESERRPQSAAWLPTAFLASAVAGGAGLLTGAVFGLMAQLKASEVNAKFDRHTLTTADQPLYDSARFRASAANVSYGLGAVGLLGAAAIYLVDPRAAGAGGEVGVFAGPDGAGARGSF